MQVVDAVDSHSLSHSVLLCLSKFSDCHHLLVLAPPRLDAASRPSPVEQMVNVDFLDPPRSIVSNEFLHTHVNLHLLHVSLIQHLHNVERLFSLQSVWVSTTRQVWRVVFISQASSLRKFIIRARIVVWNSLYLEIYFDFGHRICNLRQPSRSLSTTVLA